MADQGSVGLLGPGGGSVFPAPVGDSRLPFLSNGTANGTAPQAMKQGRITGTVTTASSATALAFVFLLHRRQRDLIVQQVATASDGTYTFADLELTEQYCVVAFDPTQTYNAVVYDLITPTAAGTAQNIDFSGGYSPPSGAGVNISLSSISSSAGVPFTAGIPGATDPRLPFYGITSTINGGVPQALRNGKITGTVTSSSVAVPNCLVILLHRKQRDLIIQSQRTDSNGAYTFADLETLEKYCVLAYDPTSTYNAVVYDLVTPTAR